MTLFDLALKVREHAYAPYSSFKVGAALRSASGKIYSGCNVENSAYPEGTCAEAGAIAAMISDGEIELLRFVSWLMAQDQFLLVVVADKNFLNFPNHLQDPFGEFRWYH